MYSQEFSMGLVSFHDQFHAFLESQSIEENPPLEKAISRAEAIIAKTNIEQVSLLQNSTKS